MQKIENGFSDVPEGYKELVNKFAATSIVDGYPNKTFGGEGNITRAEFVKMLAAAPRPRYEVLRQRTSSRMYSPATGRRSTLQHSRSLVISFGDPDGNFRPDDKVTSRGCNCNEPHLKIESAPNAAQKYTDLAKEHWAYGFIMAAAKDK